MTATNNNRAVVFNEIVINDGLIFIVALYKYGAVISFECTSK